MSRTRITLAAAAMPAALALAGGARAQGVPDTGIVSGTPAGGGVGFTTGLFAPSRTNLLGDMFGLRTAAGRVGISIGVEEISEDLGNVTGGLHRGFDYDGLTILSVGLDTEKAFGWSGGIFNVSAEQIHGRSLSADNLDTLQTASGIEADRATRLWELWYQQAFLGGAADIKVGQQSLDQEFIVSSNSGLFINTMMGWPLVPSYDLYAGGPAYPLSSLGVRLRLQPTNAITVLAGVFDDNPPGGAFSDDSQLRGAEAGGTAFSLNTGALWIGEVQWAYNQPATGEMVRSGEAPPGLPGTVKLGGWWDTAGVPDQRFDANGRSLAGPASSGVPGQDKGNWSLYAVIDQVVWRPDPQGTKAISLFLRVMGAPPDRNLISFSANGGMTLKSPFAARPNDTFGLGFGVGQVSRAAAALDTESGAPARTAETFIEATYQAPLTAWWSLQPDLQYVFHPGGGVTDPSDPAHQVGNELVLGARTAITF